ncbi:hypothetical protein E3T40_10770 [Cryobacterium sp. TMT1-19]|uniref:hypothetical protein n=1 Tax=Cryobacterium sp. TMT1-19 TaxID=1259231 RepID=UPI001068E721|nr:hypothetical protein [Cryobacterium sp. TMT1-19]TFD34356.1 hypothetical protein E3T40_10770 [Cryobacterium sp. TMT1-19]
MTFTVPLILAGLLLLLLRHFILRRRRMRRGLPVRGPWHIPRSWREEPGSRQRMGRWRCS